MNDLKPTYQHWFTKFVSICEACTNVTLSMCWPIILIELVVAYEVTQMLFAKWRLKCTNGKYKWQILVTDGCVSIS